MLKISRLCIVFVLMLGLTGPQISLGQEEHKPSDKKTRQKIDYTMTLDLKDVITKAFANPLVNLQEKLLTRIELQNDIQIDRTSMVRTERCLRDLLVSTAHLAKNSTGNKIVRAVIELKSETSKRNIWAGWKARKLEHPELKISLFYDNKDMEPTEIVCSGYKYH